MDNKELQKPEANLTEQEDEQRLISRRDFLAGLRKWSAAAIGVAVAGSVLLPGEIASGWVNGRGGWINGGGGGWVNRATTWVNGGGGGWYNRGTAWANGGGAWVNRAGGGGGAWVNRRGW
jgi:hypothetical protein